MAEDLAQEALDLARRHGVMLATAESCTGGMIVAALTDIAGSSDVVEGGYITYSNAAKQDMLGVEGGLIAEYGAVSEEVVRAMASGAVRRMNGGGSDGGNHGGSDGGNHGANHGRGRLAVAVSGIAGPGGGSAEKPVGLVWFGCAMGVDDALKITAEKRVFDGGRGAVRHAAMRHGLALMVSALSALPAPPAPPASPASPASPVSMPDG